MGLGAVPGRQAAFREGLEQAVQYAKALGCPRYWNPRGSARTHRPAGSGPRPAGPSPRQTLLLG